MIESVNIKFKRDDGAYNPVSGSVGSAGIDIAAKEGGLIPCGTTELVKTGLYFEIPEGKFIRAVPRSGLSLKSMARIPNSPGTIDSDYRGEFGIILNCDYPKEFFESLIISSSVMTLMTFLLIFTIIGLDIMFLWKSALSILSVFFNLGIQIGLLDYFSRFYGFRYNAGDRLVQIIVEDYYFPNFIEVNELSMTDRGVGGFGSTGISNK